MKTSAGRKTNLRTVGTTVSAVLVLVVVAGVLPAGASHRKISGDFVASADAIGVPGLVGQTQEDSCPLEQTGTHQVSHPLTAPFSGWLSVIMDFPEGDWELRLTNVDGDTLAHSYWQEFWDEPREELDYFLEKDQEILIVACNFSSSDDAYVAYELTHGRAWASPAGKERWDRAVQFEYISPAAATTFPTYLFVICHRGEVAGCALTPAPARARTVTIEVDDAVSPDVSAELISFGPQDSTYAGGAYFCTGTDKPLRLQPGVTWVGVTLYVGPCKDGTPATATQGTVTMTFANR